MFRKILHTLILPCNDATYLMEKKIEGKLTGKKNIQLKVHITLCKWCKVYNQKMIIIHKFLSKNQSEAIKKIPDLQQSEIELIKNKIKEKIKK